MSVCYRLATLEDVPLLALWNARLYVDEHMPGSKSLEEFTTRMHGWLARGEYQAVLFEAEEGPVAYALYRQEA
ncbi:MAG: GNAT family N-acetyltransferase, partial [Chloroflexi bacterium]|nr:GNAT family N-acetyltransferase [Chloroflexota bacterium]